MLHPRMQTWSHQSASPTVKFNSLLASALLYLLCYFSFPECCRMLSKITSPQFLQVIFMTEPRRETWLLFAAEAASPWGAKRWKRWRVPFILVSEGIRGCACPYVHVCAPRSAAAAFVCVMYFINRRSDSTVIFQPVWRSRSSLFWFVISALQQAEQNRGGLWSSSLFSYRCSENGKFDFTSPNKYAAYLLLLEESALVFLRPNAVVSMFMFYFLVIKLFLLVCSDWTGSLYSEKTNYSSGLSS